MKALIIFLLVLIGCGQQESLENRIVPVTLPQSKVPGYYDNKLKIFCQSSRGILGYSRERCVPFPGYLLYEDDECSIRLSAVVYDDDNKPPKYVIADGSFWTLGDPLSSGSQPYWAVENGRCKRFDEYNVIGYRVFTAVSFSHFGEM